jgi:hypothetical protein
MSIIALRRLFSLLIREELNIRAGAADSESAITK